MLLKFFRFTGFLFNSPSKICYEKYGCFNKQPNVRWGLIPIKPSLPQEPSVVGTTFDMYTRNGRGRVNDYDADKLKAPKFDIARRTIFVIHGWRGECLFAAQAPRKGAMIGLRSF